MKSPLPLIRLTPKIAFFDDDRRAAEAMAASVRSIFESETFSSVEEARTKLQQASDRISAEEVELSTIVSMESAASVLRQAARWMQNRTPQVEVCFCDYDMGFANGVEVLSRIKNPMVRRIIVTGVATDDIAVNAFNDGSIDSFLKKNAPNQLETIKTFARMGAKRTDSHFQWGAHSPLGVMLKGPDAITISSSIRRHLDALNVTEHIILARPCGILSRDTKGRMRWHHIETQESLESTMESLEEEGIDMETRRKIAAAECGVSFEFNNAFSRKSIEVVEMTELCEDPWLTIGEYDITTQDLNAE